MSEPFLGEIRIFGFDFAPRGWAMCNGQLIAISQNTALFSLLGTTYGGNGIQTFALPDLRGRSALHYGQGPGLSSYVLGEQIGVESVTLTVGEMASHDHPPVAQSAPGTSSTPLGDVWAGAASDQYGAVATTAMDPASVALAGGGQGHDNLSPYLTLNCCIALQGIFPSRN